MSDVTGILSQIQSGDPSASDQLLPLVYDELRKLAAAKLLRKSLGRRSSRRRWFMRPTSGSWMSNRLQTWESRQHFFAAAAEAMRRILVETARRKKRIKHGGQLTRVELDEEQLAVELPMDDLLAIDEAMARLEATDPHAAATAQAPLLRGAERRAGG